MPSLRDPLPRDSNAERDAVITALVYMNSIVLSLLLSSLKIPDDDAEVFGYAEAILSRWMKRKRKELARG